MSIIIQVYYQRGGLINMVKKLASGLVIIKMERLKVKKIIKWDQKRFIGKMVMWKKQLGD